ncbi:MAG: 2-oxoacid:ferredoxin oxidoreductase subunit gamma [Candidatus Omnitrophica bacterium]|nr:2-oxoacid:ferredoxin oxidoreductase subunit gamma [Candidatus Omnitrophota bacterium]
MIERIIIAGSGGQGIMLLGKVLAEAAMLENRFVTWLPSYGAEVRGGTAHCMVAVSDKEIGSPYIAQADSLIIMNAPSLEKFKSRVKKVSLWVINSSLAKPDNIKGGSILQHPFTDLALGLGNIKVANILALGCFLKYKQLVRLDTVSSVIKKFAPAGKEELIRINEQALRKGAELR